MRLTLLCLSVLGLILSGCASHVYKESFEEDRSVASARLEYVKEDPRAANGDCLANPKSSRDVLKDYRVRVDGVSRYTNSGRVALASIYDSLARFENKKFIIPRGTRFTFEEGKPKTRKSFFGKTIVEPYRTKASETRGNHIVLRPSPRNRKALKNKRSGGTDNHALIAHMLAYRVGKESGVAGRFYRETDKNCRLSGQVLKDKKGNRSTISYRFTEAFAAYLTNPDLLNINGCERTFEFMKDLFGEENEKITCASRQRRFNSQTTNSNAGGAIDTP